jgi:hypothetical protein
MRAQESWRADDVRPYEVLLHGAYVCLRVPPKLRRDAAGIGVTALAEAFGLHNEFTPEGGATATVAYARRSEATPGDLEDDGLLHADAVVHVAAPSAETVSGFCAGVEERLRPLGPDVRTQVLGGVLRPAIYTGNAMHNFAYGHRVLQQPGALMPNAFLLPLCKTADWWKKDWMERHTYFLPRYDESGTMVRQGHPLSAAAGVEPLLRRTYKHPEEPAPTGSYDFLTYFECSDEDLPVFHAVRAALRDTVQNPEWAFVREGPTWQGRRVASWEELFAPSLQ